MRRAAFIGLMVAVLGCSPAVPPSKATVAKIEKRIERSKNPVLIGSLKQLESPALYDASYAAIKYPNGDVPPERGACADVVVRALRYSGVDLQRLIHEDAKTHTYHRIQRLDSNIDHRRVLNQEVFFERHGKILTSKVDPSTLDEWKPGDIVSWRLPNNATHIGIVSDLKRSDGVPLVIHNISVVREEDALTRWPIHSHFRYPG